MKKRILEKLGKLVKKLPPSLFTLMRRFALNFIKYHKYNSYYCNNGGTDKDIKTWHNYSSFLPKYIPAQKVITNKITIPIRTAIENFMKNSPAKNAANIILEKSSKLRDSSSRWLSSINFINVIVEKIKKFVKRPRLKSAAAFGQVIRNRPHSFLEMRYPFSKVLVSLEDVKVNYETVKELLKIIGKE